MPELPEIEITTNNLNKIIQPAVRVEEFVFFRKNLRNKIPISKIKKLEGQNLLKIYRRAKFIIFQFEAASVISHLGMTGSWRLESENWVRKTHDHLAIRINSAKILVYHDPRRFGEFNYFDNKDLNSRFIHFGPEPLAADLDWQQLTAQFKKLHSSIKAVLMNQKYLVGVGNIYANEALFRAGIKPHKKAHRVTEMQYSKLWQQVQLVLGEAISAGGSSIQDFRNGYGEKGNFQNSFLVYGRDEKSCNQCDLKIKLSVISGRSTFWCKNCQS